ncbi:MAG: GntR family transcriptional regulator [Flavobacteriaceae bacterium]
MDVANDLHESLADELTSALDLKERKDSLVGRIASEIARAISDGNLKPGDDLNSVELASRFGTSRTPVREALMLLEKEGLVEIPPRRRPRVAHISLDEVEELYQIRAVLNGMMIGLFARTASEEELAEMSGLHEQIKASAYGDPDAFQEDRRRLHNYWLDHCGNRALRDLLSTYKMRMSVGRLVHYEPDEVERSLTDHARLVTACIDRDSDLAVALLRSMTLSGLAAIKRQYQRKA